ncbi:glycosyltransferase family 2 protein [Nevskia sp.]|uniref:glycosyltransferase family 2 protein n=1 Tax=Nevskia sp. TaxID=1929292 RepID=UPI0025F4553D|nr:glycosyltransferase family 2 protein [Nevskia sp.]
MPVEASADSLERLRPLIAIIPAHNEAPAIARVVGDVCSARIAGRLAFDRVIVVDNASSDGTADLAAEAGADIVFEALRGYGAACLAGIKAAGERGALVFIDGDASVDLADLTALLAPMTGSAAADLVIGTRPKPDPDAMSLPQRIGNRLATALIRLLWRVPVHDLGPFRVIRAERLADLAMRDVAYGWTVEMQIKAWRQGLHVVEVPVSVRVRIGQSKISGTVRGVIGAAVGIFSMIGRLWLADRQERRDRALSPAVPPARSTLR